MISEISTNLKELKENLNIDISGHIHRLKTDNISFAQGKLPKLLNKEKRDEINIVIEEIMVAIKSKEATIYQLQKT